MADLLTAVVRDRQPDFVLAEGRAIIWRVGIGYGEERPVVTNNPSVSDSRPERETRRADREIYVRMDPDIIRAAEAAERIIANQDAIIRRSVRSER